jgi:hypothetical protein
MSEDLAATESVTSTDAPVAIDPALLNKPVMPSAEATASGGDDLLKHKLGLANTHAKQAKKEADDARAETDKLRKELEDVKALQQSAAQKNLEDQGQFRQLWEETKKTVADRDSEILSLKAQLESVTQNAQQERLKASALSQINRAGALNSQQMYVLIQSALRHDDEGNPVMLNGGVEQPLGDYLANLKQSSEWQHHFGASGTSGMGGSVGGTSVAPGRDNPYRSGNLTEALRLEVENPELAKALRAEASGPKR